MTLHHHARYASPLGPAHLHLSGGDVVSLTFVCASRELAQAVYADMHARLSEGSFDFNPTMEVEPLEPFGVGARVIVEWYDEERGQMRIPAKIVAVAGKHARKVRTPSGDVTTINVGDLRLAEVA